MNWITKKWREFCGLDFPDPVVGQVWKSRNSGKSIKVTSVEIHDGGSIQVDVVHMGNKEARPEDWWEYIDSTPTQYAYGLNRNLFRWRLRLKEERRELMGVFDNCQVCHGAKGGVPGNENRIDGKIMCDYCHYKYEETLKKSKEPLVVREGWEPEGKKTILSPRPGSTADWECF